MTSLHRTAKLTALFCLSVAALGANAFELRGFRGVEWGEGAQALGAASVAYTEGEVSCYQRERENLIFGDSALNGVRYCFHQDRLFMVSIEAAVDAKALTSEFQRTYGRPDLRRGQATSWGGKSSGTRAELVADGAAARLTLYSNKIEPLLAQRMQKLNPLELTRSVAAGF
jgi:outer membrane cobalamin receptor